DSEFLADRAEGHVAFPRRLVIVRMGIEIIFLVVEGAAIDSGAVARLDPPPAFRHPVLLVVLIAERGDDVLLRLVADLVARLGGGGESDQAQRRHRENDKRRKPLSHVALHASRTPPAE